jgi:hypothetical protein
VLRRSLILPAALVALALPVSPALAGEDDGSSSATLHASQGCVSGHRVKATVTGNNIDTVAFYVDGKLVKKVSRPIGDGDGYVWSMRCSRLSVGAHRARAVVTFEEGSSPARRTLRFQITRSRQGSPRFTG